MLIEIFDPYILPFLIIITVVLNLWLVIKNVNFWIILLANVLFMVIQSLLGLKEYNILLIFFTEISKLIGDLITQIFKNIFDLI